MITTVHKKAYLLMYHRVIGSIPYFRGVVITSHPHSRAALSGDDIYSELMSFDGSGANEAAAFADAEEKLKTHTRVHMPWAWELLEPGCHAHSRRYSVLVHLASKGSLVETVHGLKRGLVDCTHCGSQLLYVQDGTEKSGGGQTVVCPTCQTNNVPPVKVT